MASSAMRIRQIRPDFWQDERVGAWSDGQRLFYVGLWNICDDAGYFVYSPSRIAVMLYPYESRRSREEKVARFLAALEEEGRIRRFEGCAHALVPTLARYQVVGGRKSLVVSEAHRACGQTRPDAARFGQTVRDWPDTSGGNVTVGNVTERNGTAESAAAPQGARGGLAEILGPFEEIIASRDGRRPA